MGNMEERYKLILGDCIERMKELPDNSVDAVITDPPYYRIMTTEWNGNKHEWDKQWNTFEKYLEWLKEVIIETKRIMKENSSLYLFADDKRSAMVRLSIEKLDFCFLNEIIWVKKNNMTIKGWNIYRSFSPITERILFFGRAESEYELTCDGLVANVFSPLRKYLIDEKDKVGITLDDVNTLVGTASMAGRHYFANSQWCFPIKEHYERMQLSFNVVFKKLRTVEEAGKMSNAELAEVLRTNYEVLRTNYEELRTNYEELRRYFEPEQNYTDVWTTNLTQSSEEQFHPTQKPISIIQRMIKTSSKDDAVILDPFMGSGTTGVACMNLNRKFIGIEIDEGYFKIAEKRIKEAANQKKLGAFE
jgi:site-specific DNA-methyltransferase (adenine-specific)